MKELYEEILQNVRTGDQLSAVFPSALIFAKKVSNVQLENWILLETNGYYNSNSAMEEGTVVPEYRSVPGRWHDIHGRPFILNDPDLQFINEYRLRNPVFDIEELSRNTSHIDLPDAKFTSKIKERFNVDVYAFRFSPKSLAGVLSSIRSHLITSLMSLGHEESIQKQESSATDFSLLHPTVKSVSGDLYKNGYYRQAILDAYIALVEEVRNKSKQSSDGTQLMQRVFSKDAPLLKVSNDPDERLGFMWLFTGAVMGIRNPKAHRIIEQNDPQRALEWLSFASVLFRVLDDSEPTLP